MIVYEFFLTHSLEKVFSSGCPARWENGQKLGGFQNETVSFQLVYSAKDGTSTRPLQKFFVSINGAPARLRKVELLPSDFPCYGKYDEHYLTTTPGMFPDLLVPFDGTITPIFNQLRSVWIDVDLSKLPAGEHEITISVEAQESLYRENGEKYFDSYAVTQNWKHTVLLSVYLAELPAQKLLHTEWFHADCLADYYKVPVFGEEHWKIIENFIRFAGQECGINLLLTPIFTQPLDTAIGGERTTIQLVGVKKHGNTYTFDFDRLERWCMLCKKYRIANIEIAHFFTQWGAHATPKIIAQTDDGEQRIFGWDVPASSPEYRHFLECLIPELISFLTAQEYTKENLFFHISDEPNETHMDSYLIAKKQVEDLLEGYNVIDALSSFEFYDRGIVEHPIPANDHIQTFIDHNVPDLWVYYCCGQCVDVPNRFYAMPSARNRIMGVLMYLYRIKGFLHWGYNFYNSTYSHRHIDPYRTTHADYAFPSGDPYLVYPGKDGEVLSSIRNQVQMDAFYDLRALELLESYVGREAVEALVLEGLEEKPTFHSYPVSDHYLLHLRENVNQEILKHL